VTTVVGAAQSQPAHGIRNRVVALVVDHGGAVGVEADVQPRRLDRVGELRAVQASLPQHLHERGRDPVGAG
jgi:hypothetical protein